MNGLLACMSVFHMLQSLGRPEEGIGSPATGVTGGLSYHVGDGTKISQCCLLLSHFVSSQLKF